MPGAAAREPSSGGVTADPDTLKCASPAAQQSRHRHFGHAAAMTSGAGGERPARRHGFKDGENPKEISPSARSTQHDRLPHTSPCHSLMESVMGLIAWIVLGLAAGLLANMLIPGKRSQGLIITCVTGHRRGAAWRLGSHPAVPYPHPARVLQPGHLAHSHRRGGRPATCLPPGHRAGPAGACAPAGTATSGGAGRRIISAAWRVPAMPPPRALLSAAVLCCCA
jgi:hypothetical protein